MSVINNNKNSLVVTSVKLVGTNLEVEYSEVQLLTAKVKKPDYKLVRELKALSTNASVLNKEVNFYKERLVVKEDSSQIDSVQRKKFIPRVIDKIIN